MQDGRRKIPKSRHDEIRKMYDIVKSTRELARIYKVSKRLIQFILKPYVYAEYLAERRARKVHKDYYNQEAHTLAIRKYRAKKKKLGLVVTDKRK